MTTMMFGAIIAITVVALMALVREPEIKCHNVSKPSVLKYRGASYAVFCDKYPNIISSDGGWYFFSLAEAVEMFERLEKCGYGAKGYLLMDKVDHFSEGRKRVTEHETLWHISQYGVNRGKRIYNN